MADVNAVISGRNFLVYSTPHDADNALPDNTVDWGVAWGTPTGQAAPWVDRGYTIGGLTFNANLERGEIRVDQEFDPVVRPVTARNITLSSNLAEVTADNFQLASGMGEVTTTAAASGIRGEDELEIGSSIADQTNSWGFDIQQPNNEAFRIVVWRGIASGSPSPAFVPDDAAQIALEVTALPDTDTDPTRIATVRDILPALP